jgi:hypothetical protein
MARLSGDVSEHFMLSIETWAKWRQSQEAGSKWTKTGSIQHLVMRGIAEDAKKNESLRIKFQGRGLECPKTNAGR